MVNVNTTSITPILKIIYEEPIAKQIQVETVLTQRIVSSNKGVTQKAGGRYVDFPVLVGKNQGISFRAENETLGDFGRARLKEVQVPLYFGYGRTRIQGQIFEIAETDVQAFANAVTNEFDVLKDSVAKDQNRIFYGTGTGQLALLTDSTASVTHTVDDAYWLEIDAQVDVLTVATAAYATGGQTNTITGVDYINNTVTFGTSVTSTGANLQMITRAGNYNLASVIQQREPSGLARMADNSVNLFGLNDPIWKANTTALNGPISEAVLLNLLDGCRRTGGKPTVMFTSLGVRRAYFALLTQQRRYQGTMEFSGGFSGLKFNYAGKDMPLVEDPDCPRGRVYAVPEKDMRVYHTKDWHFEEKTGSMFVQVPNTDAFDVLMKRYFELGLRQRNGLGALTGVSET
jgi:hypothetical protein